MMRRLGLREIVTLAFVLAAGGAGAQEAIPNAPMAPDPAQKACPPGGYAKPIYGSFGDNDGLVRAYEIASPCVGPEVRAVASAIGMGRFKPLGVKNLSTMRFQAKGRIADGRGRMVEAELVDVGIHYGLPALRIAIQGQAGAAAVKEIRVISDAAAWDETEPGVGGKPAARGALRDRAPLLKLNPFGAVWSLVEAEGHVAIRKDKAGATVLTGASPFDGYEVAVTLDAEQRPVRAVVQAEGATWQADFDGYADSWESPYLFVFPKHMVWRRAGKVVADLTVTAFHSNPYVVFPPPEPAAAAPTD